MKNEKLWKLFLKFWPLIFIVFIWFIFAHPYFLKGKVPFPSTYQVNNFAPWSAYEKLWGPVKNGAMPDIITQIYPWRHLAIEIWKERTVPLWNPYSFSGTPLLANYQSAVLSPFNILFFVLPFVDGWSILVLLQPLLAGLFIYLFVRSLNISKVGSLISSFSFMFCGFITTWMSYATLGYAILFLPFALFCIEKYYDSQKNIFLFLLSLSIPLSFFSGHFQISLYFLITILSYLIYRFIVSRSIYNTLYLSFSVFFGLLLVMPQVLPSIELYLESFRSSYFQTGGIPIEYLPSFLAPDFFGNPVTRNTWFGNYAEWNAYIGVLPFMLAIYSFLRIKKSQILFLFIFGLLSLILAVSNPISAFILNLHIPILSTSAINRIIVLFSFAFAVLAGFGYDHLFLDIKNASKKRILVWLSLFSLVFVILWIVIFQKLFIPADAIITAKQNLILPTFLFIACVAVIICGLTLKKLRVAKVFLPIIHLLLIVLVVLDLLRFAKKWQAFDPKNFVFADTPTTKAFSKISGFNKVLGNFGGEAFVYYHLSSVEGYDALYSKRYGEFMGFVNNGEIIKSAWSVVSFPRDNVRTEKALNLLNIKYIAHKLKDNKKSWTFPFWIYPKDQFKLIYKDPKYEFYENAKALPHVFLVGQYRVIPDSQKILNTVFSEDFDFEKEIILEKDPKIIKSEEIKGSVAIEDYKPNKINLTVNAGAEGFVFISDSYNKGWDAKVDGRKTPIYRANYTFRAIPIEDGKHMVELVYDPLSFKLGLLLSLLGVIGVITFTFLIPKTSNR